MTEGLRPYPEYRESGVAWLGRVPAHWETAALRHRFTVQLGKMLDTKRITGQHLVPYLRNTDVQWDRVNVEDLPTMDVRPDEYDRYTVRAGDLLVCEGGEVGRAAVWGGASNVYAYQKALHRLRPLRANRDQARYLYYALFDVAKRGVFRADGSENTIAHLPADKLRGYRFAFPPTDEQDAIIRYLDAADRRIRRYVRAKQRLIALLGEQKRLIVHGAVTRGIDPNVSLKPSGVNWLGDVPAHWEVHKLKQLTQFRNGLAFKPGDWKHTGVPIIRIQNLNGSDDFNYTDAGDLPNALLIQPGDLLFAWSGNRGTSFGPFVWARPFAAYLNQHIFKLHGYGIDSEFFLHLLHAVTRHVEEQTHGIIGLVHVTKPELGSVVVPVPPPEEQKAIVRHVRREYSTIDVAIGRAHREIELLREYRTRLVADVVTGKLDVRAASARLPNKADDSDVQSVDDDAAPDEDAAEDAPDLEPAEA